MYEVKSELGKKTTHESTSIFEKAMIGRESQWTLQNPDLFCQTLNQNLASTRYPGPCAKWCILSLRKSCWKTFTWRIKCVSINWGLGFRPFFLKWFKRITLSEGWWFFRALRPPTPWGGLDTTFISTQFGHRGTVGYLARNNKADQVTSCTNVVNLW